MLKEKERALDELPKMVGKMVSYIKTAYEQFTGSNLVSLEESKNLESCPRQQNTIFYKIQDFITENSEDFNPALEDNSDDCLQTKRKSFFETDGKDEFVLFKAETDNCLKSMSAKASGKIWSRNITVSLGEIDDIKLLRYLHPNMVNLEINIEGLTQRDAVLKDFYNKISSMNTQNLGDMSGFNLPKKICIEFVFLKSYKAVLVKMYDVDKPHVLYNDEYLECLYKGSCDKISHLLNINTKLNDSMNDANGMPISRQTQNDDVLSKNEQASDDGSIKNELNLLTTDPDNKNVEKSRHELQSFENDTTDNQLQNASNQDAKLSNNAEMVIHENYLLIPFVQNLAESYMGRKYMINNFLVDLYSQMRKKAQISFTISWLKKEKTIPMLFHRKPEVYTNQNSIVLNNPYRINQINSTSSKNAYGADVKLDSVSELNHEDIVRYLETPKHLKKIMKGRKPDETRMDSILSKNTFLKELNEKQRLTWASSIENEELLKYYNLTELTNSKNTYLKVEQPHQSRQIIAVFKIPKYLLTENISVSVTQRTSGSIKRKYDEQLQSLVSKVERSKIFNYIKPHTQSTLFQKYIEKQVNLQYNQKVTDHYGLFRMIEDFYRLINFLLHINFYIKKSKFLLV